MTRGAITGICGLVLLASGVPARADTDFSLPVGGAVTLELLRSAAGDNQTLSVSRLRGEAVQPLGGTPNGCRGREVIIGQDPLIVARARLGCRIHLNNPDQGNPPFPAATPLRMHVEGGLLDEMNATPLTLATGGHDPRAWRLSWHDGNGQEKLVLALRIDMDADGDGLWDDWEAAGIDFDGDGRLDCVKDARPGQAECLTGADPFRKDIFLWIDWMDCAQGDCVGPSHSHRPAAASLRALVDLFDKAPVHNPPRPDASGGSIPTPDGIRLHLVLASADAGRRAVDSVDPESETRFGPLALNSTPHQEFLDSPCRPQMFENEFKTRYKDRTLGFFSVPARYSGYRYALFAHRQHECEGDTSTGCAELPGANLVVTLADWDATKRRPEDAPLDAVALLHELGHNLSLEHRAHAPNYQSVMNYLYFDHLLDYSRQVLPDLVEAIPIGSGQLTGGLDETKGLPGARAPVYYHCPNPDRTSFNPNVQRATNPAAIDWDCDGRATNPAVLSDLNGDRACIVPGCDGRRETPATGIGLRGTGGQIWNGGDRLCHNGEVNDIGIPVIHAQGDDLEVRSGFQPAVLKGFEDWSSLRFDLIESTGSAGGGCGGLDPSEGPPLRSGPQLTVFAAPAPTSCRGAGLADNSNDLTRINLLRVFLRQTAPGSPVLAGSAVTFHSEVDRNPDVALSELEVVNTLTGPGTFTSCPAPTADTTCEGEGLTRVLGVETIPRGVIQPFDVTAILACSAPDGARITNTALAHYPDLALPEEKQQTVAVTVSNPPPVFTFVPPAITVSQCSRPEIGQARAEAGSRFCRASTVAVTNDAPATFPVGRTTLVTWTATDAAGQKTTATQSVTAILGDHASCCPAGTRVIVGTEGPDLLVGTLGRDCILGRGGSDVIVGLGGGDVLSGGEGNDILAGGTGDDLMFGGPGNDILQGLDGDDRLWGGDGDDQLDGGDGNDELRGEGGNDQLNGGRGDDLLDGGAGTNICTGGFGNDRFVSCASRSLFDDRAQGPRVCAYLAPGSYLSPQAPPWTDGRR